MAKRKAIQYAVKQAQDTTEDGVTDYFCFYDKIEDAVSSETSNEKADVEVWKFEGEVLGTYRLKKVAKKVKG